MTVKHIGAALCSVAIAVSVGCDGRTPAAPTTHPSPSPAAATPTSIGISGRTSSQGDDGFGNFWLAMTPGETAQLRATAFFSDGTSQDVTTQAQWIADDRTGAVSFDAPGLVRARAPGSATVVAKYGPPNDPGQFKAETSMRVMPEGAFFLISVGVGDGTWAMSDARVQVTSAVGTFWAQTNLWGLVASLPAIGDTVIHVEKVGYRPVTASVRVSSNNDFFVYDLKP